MIALLLKNWQAALGGIAALVLGTLLVIQKGETRHWHKQADSFAKLYHDEQAAHRQTVANYRAAADAARAADKANADRVIAQQKAINERTTKSYEARLADARARAERLRQSSAAHPGSPGAAPVPGSSPAPVSPAGPAAEGGLSPGDALIATEQAIQLDELIKWIKSQPLLTPQGSSSPYPKGSR